MTLKVSRRGNLVKGREILRFLLEGHGCALRAVC